MILMVISLVLYLLCRNLLLLVVMMVLGVLCEMLLDLLRLYLRMMASVWLLMHVSDILIWPTRVHQLGWALLLLRYLGPTMLVIGWHPSLIVIEIIIFHIHGYKFLYIIFILNIARYSVKGNWFVSLFIHRSLLYSSSYLIKATRIICSALCYWPIYIYIYINLYIYDIEDCRPIYSEK